MPRQKKKKYFTFKTNEGVEYEVHLHKPNTHHYGEADGICYPPIVDRPKIYINPYLNKQRELNTSIHEFAHAFFWDKTEKEVYSFANALSRFLYNDQKWRKLRKGQYSKGKVHKSKLLEKERPPKNEQKKRKRAIKRNRKSKI
jgi:hypothetical protein